MDSTRVAVAAPYQKAMEILQCGNDGPKKMAVSICAAKHSRDDVYKLNTLRLAELHITICESGSDDTAEISQLYEICKLLRLGVHPLTVFSVTYQVNNGDSSNTSARLMIISNLLNQLNWDSLHKTDLNLHINYLENDPRLELLEELPVNVSISGITGCSEDAAMEDRSKLSMLEKSYSYLDGCL